jgi:glutathione S-transferase
MMKLLSALPSPFGRKVKMTARLKGLDGSIAVELVDTSKPNPALAAQNPLAKIPVLILDDGTQIYDSHVICEYLDSLAPAPRLFPSGGLERYRMLTRAALADGLLDAAILIVYESRFRPEAQRVQGWLDRQHAKIDGGLDHLEAAPPVWTGTPDYADVTLACALGYLDLRLEGAWRARCPRLVAWLDAFARDVPAFEATRPTG